MEHLITWFKAGRGRKIRLAETLGIHPSAVSQWVQVPAERVLDVERVSGISRHDLRPDVFGPASAEGQAA